MRASPSTAVLHHACRRFRLPHPGTGYCCVAGKLSLVQYKIKREKLTSDSKNSSNCKKITHNLPPSPTEHSKLTSSDQIYRQKLLQPIDEWTDQPKKKEGEGTLCPCRACTSTQQQDGKCRRTEKKTSLPTSWEGLAILCHLLMMKDW